MPSPARAWAAIRDWVQPPTGVTKITAQEHELQDAHERQRQLANKVAALEAWVAQHEPQPTVPFGRRVLAVLAMPFAFVTGLPFVLVHDSPSAWVCATSFGFMGLKLVAPKEFGGWIGAAIVTQFIVLAGLCHPDGWTAWAIHLFWSFLYATFWTRTGIILLAHALVKGTAALAPWLTVPLPNLAERELVVLLPIPAMRLVLGCLALTQTGDVSWRWAAGVSLVLGVPMAFLPRTDTTLNEADPIYALLAFPIAYHVARDMALGVLSMFTGHFYPASTPLYRAQSARPIQTRRVLAGWACTWCVLVALQRIV